MSLYCVFTGESGLGKTTLINTLFATELSPAKNYSRRHVKQLDKLTEVRFWPYAVGRSSHAAFRFRSKLSRRS